MVGTENETDDVRNDETDVADGAADGDGQAGEKRSGDVNHKAHTPNVHAKMHGFLFAGKKNIQIIGGGVDNTRSEEKAGGQEPINAFLKGRGKITHQPEDHAASVAAVHGAQQKHNDGG